MQVVCSILSIAMFGFESEQDIQYPIEYCTYELTHCSRQTRASTQFHS